MNTIKKIFKNIKNESLLNKIKIILNIGVFFIISKIIDSFFSYDDKVKYYYMRLPFPVVIKGRKVDYFFKLNSFIELYEENEFLEEILNDNSEVFIDIGANIGRISSLISCYNHNFKKIFALEPNRNCLDLSLSKIPKTISSRICFLNYGIGKNTQDLEMTITDDSATTVGTLNKEKSVLKDFDESNLKKIKVKILSFEDFFKENNLSIYKNFFIKIDVEGYEEYVFESIFDFINKNKGKYNLKIITEILPWNKDLFYKLESFGIKKENIKRLGEGNDYMFKI